MRLIKGYEHRRGVLQEYKMRAISERYFPVVSLPSFLYRYREIDYNKDTLRYIIKDTKPKIEIKWTSELFKNEEIKKNINMQNIHFDDVKRLCQHFNGENYNEDHVDKLLEQYRLEASLWINSNLKKRKAA